MNPQRIAILSGIATLLFFVSKRAASGAAVPTPSSKKGLTITENEALGYIMANKLAYPALGFLPESAVMATIAVESNFDPNAVAPAGERGLMQVIYPGTWNDVLKRSKLPSDLDSFAPKDNILVGMFYLKLVHLEFYKARLIHGSDPNDWPIIDQGYNLGPAGVIAGKENKARRARFELAREKYQRAGLP